MFSQACVCKTLWGGVTHSEGYPSPRWGYPNPRWGGYPKKGDLLERTWLRYPPLWTGVLPSQDRTQAPPWSEQDWDTPPPPQPGQDWGTPWPVLGYTTPTVSDKLNVDRLPHGRSVITLFLCTVGFHFAPSRKFSKVWLFWLGFTMVEHEYTQPHDSSPAGNRKRHLSAMIWKECSFIISTTFFQMVLISTQWPVVDPEFLRKGGCQLPRFGRQPIIWPNFYRKVHENQRIWTQGGIPGTTT